MPATADNYSDFFSTTLAGGAGGVGTSLNPADTTLFVTSSSNAPAAVPFPLVLTAGPSNEIVKVTAISGGPGNAQCTVVRAQDGTSALTWAPTATVVAHDLTAGGLTNLWTAVNSGRVFNVKDYGAKGDGSTDDSAAIASAVAAAVAARGGVVYFPASSGAYLWTPATTLSLASSNGVVLAGDCGGLFDIASTGGAAATGVPASELRYTATGSQTFINAQQAMGFALDGLAVRYSSTTYTGRLIDAGSAGVTANPSVGLLVRRALLAGTTSTANGAILLYLDGMVDALLEAVTFGYATTGVIGRDASAGSGFSNGIVFLGCRFTRLTTAVLNPAKQWAFTGCTFEINPSNNPAPVKSQDGTRPCAGLSFVGCGFWDSSGASSGFWVDVFGNSASFTDCFVDVLGAGSGFVRINTDATLTTFDGLVLHGMTFNGGGGTILTTAGTGGFSNLDIGTLSNLGALTDPTSSLDLTTNPISFAPVRSTLAFSSYSTAGAVNIRRDSVQAITLTGTPVTPTFPSVQSGVAHKIRLELVQDATGSRLVTWPASVKWGTPGAPTLSTAANAIDVVEFVSRDGGVTWRGVLIAKGY